MDLESFQEGETTESELNTCYIEEFPDNPSTSETFDESFHINNHQNNDNLVYEDVEVETPKQSTLTSLVEYRRNEPEQLGPYFCGLCASFIENPKCPMDLRLGSIMSDQQLAVYADYLDHLKAHVMSILFPEGAATEEYTEELVSLICHYFHKNNLKRQELLRETKELFLKYIPKTCTWRRTILARESLPLVTGDCCGYEFDSLDVDDFLRHTYFHAHQTRIEECGVRLIKRHQILEKFANTAGIPTCLARQLDPLAQYASMDKFGGLCKWVIPREGVEPCSYFSFVPEFLARHLHDEVDCYWSPLLWKKDQMIGCNWEGCDFIVDTNSKGAKTMNRLKAHVCTHLVLKNIACPYCCDRLSTGKRLEDHFARQYPKDGTHSCDVCGKLFPTKVLLRDHLTNHNRKFACPVDGCKHMARNFRAVATHLQYVHSDERKFGPCPFCEKYFKTLKDYKAHVVTHNKSGEFKCTNAGCDFVTTTLKKLRYHERFQHKKTEVGESVKGYKCHICHDKVFTRGFKLSQHFRKDHKEEDPRFADPKEGTKRHRFQYLLQPDGFYMLDNSSQAENYQDIHMPDLERKEMYTIPAKTDLFITDYQQDFGMKSKTIYECPHCKLMFRKKKTLDAHIEQCDIRPGSQFLAIVGSMETRIQHLSAELQAEVELKTQKRKAEETAQEQSSKKPFAESLPSTSKAIQYMKPSATSITDQTNPQTSSIAQVDSKLKIPSEGQFIHLDGKFYYQLNDKETGKPLLFQISEDSVPSLEN